MKNRIFLFLIIQTLFSIETIFAQITFQKTFDGPTGDCGFSVQQTSDGGYITAGMRSGGVYLIKTDANGDSLWTKIFGGTSLDFGYSVRQTTDGGYIIAGYTGSFGAGSNDAYLIKTDSIGNDLWAKCFGGAHDDRAYSVQQTTDGGYIISGLFSLFYDDTYFYLIKTDSNGNIIWAKTLGAQGTYTFDNGKSVEQTADGGYIITGTTISYGAGNLDVYLIKTDTSGNVLWSKTFGGTNDDGAEYVHQTSDGGYIITGYTGSFGSSLSDEVYLIRTDANGDSLWTKTFGGINHDEGRYVQQTTDGGFIIAGRTYSFGAGDADVYLIKTDMNGNSLWTKTFGGADYDESWCVQQCMDDGYIISGSTFSFGVVNSGLYLIKTDSLGNNGCNQGNTLTIVTTPMTQITNPATVDLSLPTIVTTPALIVGSGGIVTTHCPVGIQSEIPNPKSEISFSPNPFSNEINIISSTDELYEIILYDITSRKLLQQIFTNSVSINASQLSKGIYICEVRTKNGVIGKKKIFHR